jgi:hypothetical protein
MTGTTLSHRSDEERRVPATAVVQAELVAHQLARELLTNAERDAGEVARRIHAQMPEFGSHAAVTAQTVDAVRAVIAAYARMCLRGVEATEVAPPAEAVEYANAFAHRGIELPLLVRSYRLGHAELWALLTRMIDRLALPPEVTAAARGVLERRLFAYIDHTTNALIDEYESERKRWVRSPEAQRIDAVSGILEGRSADPHAAVRALRYGLDLDHVGVVLSVDRVPEGQDPRQLLCSQGDALADASGASSRLLVPFGRLVLWGWLGARAGAEDVAASVERWRPPEPAGQLAVGEPGSGVAGFRRTHREALAARRLQRLAGRPAAAVTRWGPVAALGLLATDVEHASAFIASELGSLGAEDEPTERLRATLLAYLQEQDRLRTGERLHVHPNTVGYRLRQCEELLGRCIKQRRFETEAALRLRELLGPAS